MKKKVFSLTLVICCLAVFLTSSTLAYFTKEDTATNVITTGKIDIDLVEQTTDSDGETITVAEGQGGGFTVEGVMPGQEVMKVVTVKNINNAQPAFVRVWVDRVFEYAREDEGELVVRAYRDPYRLITADFNTEDWTMDDDGYIYYNEILGTGEETAPLFTKVMFAPEMGNEFQESTFTVDIYAEAVQSRNIKDSDGNPVTRAIDVPENIWPGYVGAQ